MKNLHFPLTGFLLLSAFFLIGNNLSIDKEQVKQLIKHQPVQFLENKGQMTDMDGNPVPFILFKASAPWLDMYITGQGISYVFLQAHKDHQAESGKQPLEEIDKKENKIWSWERIDMSLNKASIKKENIITEGQSTHFNQYFLGHCPQGITDVHSYKKITIKDVYPGIDWVFYNSNEKGFKYDFIVHPGANPNDIQLVYSSLNPVNLNSKGNLEITSKFGTIIENAPYSYIKETGKQINSSFNITKQQTILLNHEEYYQAIVSFNFSPKGGDREGAYTLIIDPQLYWATFFGGNLNDGPQAATTDNAGNLFVTGYILSNPFPLENSGTFFQGTFNGSPDDAFILKFNNTGNLLWATYCGGNVSDQSFSITTDNNNNVLLTGMTSSTNFPLQNAGTFFQPVKGGGLDAFILKFDNAGTLLWSTYFGGNSGDIGYSIATDNNNNIFITGMSVSSIFPVQNAGSFFQGTPSGSSDIFISKFDNAGNLIWSTFYGGSSPDEAYSIVSDNNGNIFLAGSTHSTDFPIQTTGTFLQNANAGMKDACLLKFDNNGNLLWATYFGGSSNDIAHSLTSDVNGNVFVVGSTASTNFPIVNGGFFLQNTFNGGTGDAYIAKLDNACNLVWCTYYGGSGDEGEGTLKSFNNLTTDKCGNIYWGFETNSTDIVTQPPCDGGYYDNTYNGGTSDLFLVSFSNSGMLYWGTYFGGNGKDFRSALITDNMRSLFIAGEWTPPINNTTYPRTNPGGAYYDGTFNGDDDGFIAKFNKVAPYSPTTTAIDANCGCDGKAIVSINNNCAPYNYVWSSSLGGGNQTLNTTSTADSLIGLCPGNYSVSVYFNCDTFKTTLIIGNTPGNLSVNNVQVNADVTCLEMGSATATASDGTQPYTFSWSSGGQTTATATGLTIGIHTVTVTDNNLCAYTTTVIIADNTTPPDIITGTPSDLNCAVSSVTLSAGSSVNGVSYSWDGPGIISDGTSPAPSVNIGGIYTVTVTNPSNGCINTASVTVNIDTVSPNLVAGNPLILGCTPSMGIINASSTTNGVTFNWAGPGIVSGEATSSPTVNMEGTYTVTITNPNNGCTNTATIIVTNDTTEPELLTGDSLILECGSTSGNLSASSTTSGANFFWTGPGILSGETTSTPLVNTQGSYTVTVTNPLNGCSKTDSVRVVSNMEGGDIFVPNAFSPNSDGENELECIYGGCIQNISFIIYNRWGERVFETSNLTECWNGTYKGKVLDSGIFVFYLQATLITGEITTRQGNISLIR